MAEKTQSADIANSLTGDTLPETAKERSHKKQHMKIRVWNCNMSFRTKAEFILSEKPDILIVPECEKPEHLNFGLYTQQPTQTIWFGKNQHKGIGIFSYSNYKLELLDIHKPDFKYVLPIAVSNGNEQFVLFAVWTQKPETNENYVVQIWNAMNYYSDILDSEDVIIAGDFNSNTIFDKPTKIATHSNLVKFLMSKRIVSTYHYFYNHRHGLEEHPTHFWKRKFDKPFHIDYCFASSQIMMKLKNVQIGNYETWTKHSDHKPLIVEFKM